MNTLRPPPQPISDRRAVLAATLRQCAAAIERSTTAEDLSFTVSIAREALAADSPDLKLIAEQLERISQKHRTISNLKAVR